MVHSEVVGTYRSQWGEGPLWWQGKLYYVDIEGKRVIRYDPLSGEEQCWQLGQRVGTIVPRQAGGLVGAGDNGFFFLDEADGRVEPIADPEADVPNNRFNDGKCSPDGHFFAGTISLIKQTGAAKLYRLGADRSVAVAYGPVTNSNGIGWSPDGRHVYYIDTPRKELLVFDYAAGQLVNPRAAFTTSHRQHSPDGLAVDAAGNVWIAFCHGGYVVCFDPHSGRELEVIHFPCVETTACAFGGPELDVLYVTTGMHQTLAEEHAGRLFCVTGLGVRGLPANAYAG